MTSVGWDLEPEVADWPGLPRLAGVVRADVCVIGLGGSGLAAIEAATSAGCKVVGIDAGRVAAGAAGRNGGFLLAGPALAVHEAAQRWGTEITLWLYNQTLDQIKMLAYQLGPDVVRSAGSIRLAGLPGDPVDDAEAADREREQADCAEQLRFMEANQLWAEEYSGPLGNGLMFPQDAAVNPARRVLGLVRRFRGSVELYEHSPVLSIAPELVVTAHGQIQAGLIVVAVDGGLEVLLPELAGHVRTARLQMLATEPLPVRLPCPVYGRWGYDYAQQDGAGRLFVGGGRDLDVEAEWTTSAEPTPPVQGWIEQVAARFAGQPVKVSHRWAASVGYTPDARPIVARVRPGVVACGGYNGTGNLVGPVAARAAVALGLEQTPVPACFNSDPVD